MYRYFFFTKQNSKIQMQKSLSFIGWNLEIEKLVVHLTTLLKNWNKSPNIIITQLR